MQNRIQPTRPHAGPVLAEVEEAPDAELRRRGARAPRRRLIVEVYAPPPVSPGTATRARSSTAIPTGHTRLRRGAGFFLTALIVLALHASLGVWLFLDSRDRPLPRAAPTAPIDLLPPIDAAVRMTLTDVAADLLPDPVRVAPLPPPKPPHLDAFLPAPLEVPFSLPANTPVRAADPTEETRSVRECGIEPPHGSVAARQLGELSALIRVEPDGHVSSIGIEHSSGDGRIDADVQRCLSTHATFTAKRLRGQWVPSWQRWHWPG